MLFALDRLARHALEDVEESAQEAAGGPARLHIILLLGAVLALDAADKAAVSAVAGTLEKTFRIGHTDLGLLIACSSFVGAAFTLPAGSLVDRMSRRRIMLVFVSLWTVAMVISGTATSFAYLLVTRCILGAATAAAVPAVASLVGDFFPARARAHAYGLILAGELIGVGFGFVFAGEISSLIGWRWSFILMGVPSVAIGWAIWRYLPEPARGGQSWIRLGQRKFKRRHGQPQPTETDARPAASKGGSGPAPKTLPGSHARPRRDLVPAENPASFSLWRVIAYLLKIPTYRLLVLASSLGYYFFAGIRAFGMIYFTQHYHVSRSTMGALIVLVGIGAVAGVTFGGRFSEWLLRRGVPEARIIVPATALLTAAVLLVPAIWSTNLIVGIMFLVLGTAALSTANPPIDAARLDIVPPGLWGRGEAGRMALRGVLEGGAPILFGAISEAVGLELTFLIMLLPLVAASALGIPAYRSYPRDVATAQATFERHRKGSAA